MKGKRLGCQSDLFSLRNHAKLNVCKVGHRSSRLFYYRYCLVVEDEYGVSRTFFSTSTVAF